MKLIGLSLVVMLASCGGGDSLNDFAGTWTPSPGAMLSGTCSNGNPYTVMLTTAEVYAKGVDADITSTSGGCTLRFDVNGKQASARAGQSCTSMSNGITTVLTVQTTTLTLGSDSKTMTESAMGTVVLSGAVTGTCTAAGT